MANQNNRRGAIKKLKLLTYNSKTTVDQYRAKLEEEYKTMFLPNKVERSEYKYGNIVCDVLAPEIYSSNRILIYVHGGCFVGGSRVAYRAFCSSIASKTYSRVIIPEYRLAPGYTCPAAIEDIQSVFKGVFTEEQIACSLNSEPGKIILPEIILAGDGSAASLICSLIFNLRDRYRNCIKEVVLFSPWLDVSENSRILNAKKSSDEIMSADVIRKSCADYTYAANTNSPNLSPLLADDGLLKNFPPVYIQMGEKEILLEDAKYFAERLVANGNQCKLDVWPDMMYMFQMADEYLKESHLALDKIGYEITDHDFGEKAVQIDNQPPLEYSLKSEA
ncbi:MAG: alpha/beta hydrolase [Treponema sp.]|nr:alpha/beta hydrolase [Treponema sp.]